MTRLHRNLLAFACGFCISCILASIALVQTIPIGTLQWGTPTQNVGGTALTDLAGYNIYSSTSATTPAKIASVGLVNAFKTTPDPNKTTYFWVSALNKAGTESALAGPVSLSPPKAPTKFGVH